MAELQSKLKGRGKINPTHTTSIRMSGGRGKQEESVGEGSSHILKEVTLKTPVPPTLLPEDTSSSGPVSGKSVKMMKLRIESTSPDIESRQSSGQNYSPNDCNHTPTTIQVDITERPDNVESPNENERKKPMVFSGHSLSSSFIQDSKSKAESSPVRKYSAPLDKATCVAKNKASNLSAVTKGKGDGVSDEGGVGVRELARIFSARSKETSKEKVTGLHRKTVPKGIHWSASSQSSLTPVVGDRLGATPGEKGKADQECKQDDSCVKSNFSSKTVKEQLTTVSPKKNDSHYENMFAGDWTSPTKPSPSQPSNGSEKGARRPVPTPRKSTSPSASSANEYLKEERSDSSEGESEDEEYVYELIEELRKNRDRGTKDPNCHNLKKLQSELELLEGIISLPPLGEDKESAETREAVDPHTTGKNKAKVSKSSSSASSIAKRNTPKLLKELRKGVVTDVEKPLEEEYITMSSIRPLMLTLSSTQEESEYHTPVIPTNKTNSKTSLNSNAGSPTRTPSNAMRGNVTASPVNVRPSSSLKEEKEENKEQNKYLTMKRPTEEEEMSRGEEQNQYMTMRHPSVLLKPVTQQGGGGGAGKGLSDWKRSQGSIFASEMINFMDQQESLYCKIPERRPITLDDISCPTTESLSDDTTSEKYIDVCNIPFKPHPSPVKQTTPISSRHQFPPPIPNRPLVGPAAPKITRSNPIFSSKVGKDSIHFTGGDFPPPLLPPKSESLLREQGIFEPSKSPPLVGGKGGGKVKSKSEKKAGRIINRSPILEAPPKPDSAKNLIRALKKEAFATKSNPEPRRPLPLPASASVSSRKTSEAVMPDCTSLDSKSTPLQHATSSPNFLLVNKPSSPIPIAASVPTDTPKLSLLSGSSPPLPLFSSSPGFERKGVVRRKQNKKAADISRKINRDSLAVILCNKDIITEQLKQKSIDRKETRADWLSSSPSHSPQKDTLVHSLGQILVDISSLLDDKEDHLKDDGANDEDSLVDLIESELNVALHNNPSYTTSFNNVNSTEEDEDYNVVITDKDVQDVVKYFDENRSDESATDDFDSPRAQNKAALSRSFSDAMLIDSPDDILRSDSVSSLPDTNDHSSSPSDEEYMEILDVSKSITVAAEKLAIRRGSSINAPLMPSDRKHSLPNGVGYFTSSGGIITSKTSGVVVEVPPGVVPKGRRQKLWFEVHQSVYRDTDPEDAYSAFSNPGNESKSDNMKKKESKIQLSPIVFIGPPDAILRKPLKINIPHCVPTDTSAWHVKIQGRGHNSRSDEWVSLTQASGHFLPRPGTNKKSFKNSTYQIHPNYARIKTKIPGCFRLVGRPIAQNPNKVVKKMVCSIYTETQRESSVDDMPTRVKVFFVNAVLDSVEALDRALTSEGYSCLERNIPMVVYGNKTDLEVSIITETFQQKRTILHSQVIPYAMFWRATRIGSARITLDVDGAILKRNKLLKLTVSQSSMETLEMEFMLP
ncbi:PREDICTED: uncharacterized protein LOC100635004 isoform X2 [Amphimedon queenslandica]|nr:PREDICTED: uncharacterized protein LOC100635004 isoform X2 [Amphimedon queenslandica]|eukprot:XP_019849439.1 PREDICTED: uncharacterized protein LOC100635004 isoform X2 [Amphimedon queenslandica]